MGYQIHISARQKKWAIRLGVAWLVMFLLVQGVSRVAESRIRQELKKVLPQAKVEVRKIRLNVWRGSIDIRDMSIGLPPNTDETNLSVKRIYVSVGLWSLLRGGDAPVVVSKVLVDSPKVLLEGGLLAWRNVDVGALQSYAEERVYRNIDDALVHGDGESRAAKEQRPPRRFIISSFEFTGGEVAYRGAYIGLPLATVPPLRLSNIGAEQGGMTMPEIGRAIAAHYWHMY